MSRAALIEAFNLLAEAAAKVAIELEASEQPASEPAAAGGVSRSAPPPAPLDTSVCPKHGVAFTPSKNPDWPSFCSKLTDDPAWGKPKRDRDGNDVLYCRITSRNAGEWLAVNGRPA